MFDELLDGDPYLQERDTHVAQEAELRILRKMITRIVQKRFPNLTAFAQSKVAQIASSEKLQTLVEQVAVTPDENFTRTLLDISTAA